MKLTHTRPFSGNRHELVEQGESQTIGHLIPLVDEVNQILTLTCQYCGATSQPIELTEDGSEHVCPHELVFHLTSCPLVLSVWRH